MLATSLIALALLAADPPSPKHLGYLQDSRTPQTFYYSGVEKPRWNNQLPHIVAIVADSVDGTAGAVTFNNDATQIGIVAPPGAELTIDTADRTQQFTDGTWAFVANDAKVHGTNHEPKAFFENHKGNYRIGGWHQIDDYVTWDFDATRWGRYYVDLTYSLADGTTEIEIDVAGDKVTRKLDATGSWYRYVTIDLDPVYLATAGKKTLTVRSPKRTGAASLNLKAVLLRPAPEGRIGTATPDKDGVITLHAKDAQIDGVTLRYEPDEKKNCLGYWSNVNDRAMWYFSAPRGEYHVEVYQGCGKGQGGSIVEVAVDDQRNWFTVEDTGHFQNFKPQIIGQMKFDAPGDRFLRVIPRKKAKGAVMDIRQIRLIPVK